MQAPPTWNPQADHVLADPETAHDHMRCHQPLAHSEALGWSVFRHADVSRVLADPHTFSSRVSRHLVVPNGMDPPEHTRYRQLLDPYFSDAAMARLEPQYQAICAELMRGVPADTEVEVTEALAHPFALQTLCGFLGWPEAMEPALRAWIALRHAAVQAGDAEALRAVAFSFDATIRALLAERRARGDQGPRDVTASLLALTLDGRPLSDDELVSILRNWTVGELGTMAASAGLLAHHLATHPELQDRLRADPGLVPAANDEILRIHAPLPTNRRVTTRPCTLGGVELPAGARLTLMWGAANRDESVFESPLACDPGRDAAPNLLYGAGIHACPGAPLARMALVCFVQALLAHTRRLALAPSLPAVAARWPVSGFQQLGLRFSPA